MDFFFLKLFAFSCFYLQTGVKNVCGGAKNPMDLFSYGDKDGKGTEARLQHPLGVASISADKLYIADSYNHKIKLVTELASKTPVCSTCPVEGQGFILSHFSCFRFELDRYV